MNKFDIKKVPTSCIIMFILSVILLAWGIYQLSLANAGKKVGEIVFLDDGAASAENNGKYVVATGNITAENGITDPSTGVHVDGLMLLRNVEMYQYDITGSESVGTDFCFGQNYNLKGNGGEEIINPVLPEELQNNVTFFAKASINGNCEIDERYIDALINEENDDHPSVRAELVPVTQFDGSLLKEGFRAVDGYIVNGDTEDPELGDLRISYMYIPVESVGKVTVFGKQENMVIGQDDNAYSALTAEVGDEKQFEELVFGKYRKTASTMFFIAAVLIIIAGLITGKNMKNEDM